MTRSMTGFARQEQTFSWGNAIWELRSVNHRYLETSFRLPDTLRELEPKLRDAVRQTLQRDRKSTRLNSSHVAISYAVFCLKKKKIHRCNSRFTLQKTLFCSH